MLIVLNVKTFHKNRDVMTGWRRGFTLLEVVITMVIITVLAAGIFATTAYAKRMSLQLQEKAVAVSLVETRMNELRQMGARAMVATGNAPALEPIPNLRDGSLATSVTAPFPGNERVKEAVVRVSWTDIAGAVRMESAASYFFDS